MTLGDYLKKLFKGLSCTSSTGVSVPLPARRSPIAPHRRSPISSRQRSPVSSVACSSGVMINRRNSFDSSSLQRSMSVSTTSKLSGARLSFSREYGQNPLRKDICHYCRMVAGHDLRYRSRENYVFNSRIQLMGHINSQHKKMKQVCTCLNHDNYECNNRFPDYEMLVEHCHELHPGQPLPPKVFDDPSDGEN